MVEVFDANQQPVARIEGCQSHSPYLRLNVKIQDLELKFKIQKEMDSTSWLARDELSTLRFELPGHDRLDCLDSTATRKLLDDLRPKLASSIQDCLDLSESFQCRSVPVTNLTQLQIDLEKLRHEVVKKARRIPYIMARRFGIVNQLIGTHDDKTRCNVVSQSDIDELPLSLQKNRHQFCTTTGTDYLIQASALELRQMSRIITEQTHWGYITLKLPEIGNKDIEFSIEKNISSDHPTWNSKVKNTISAEPISHCFYPLYHEDQIKQLAVLGMLSLQDNCTFNDQKALFSLSKSQFDRVMSLVASEMQFTVTNGRSKMIRLPQGHYSYDLQANGESIGRGTILWEGRQPRVQIQTSTQSQVSPKAL